MLASGKFDSAAEASDAPSASGGAAGEALWSKRRAEALMSAPSPLPSEFLAMEV
jgi:hypothetical protein